MNIKTCKIVNPWCPLGIRFPKMLVMLLLMKYNDLSTYTQKGKKNNIAQETHDLCGSTSGLHPWDKDGKNYLPTIK